MRTPLALTTLAVLLSVGVPAFVRAGSLNGWPEPPSAVRYRDDAVIVRLAAGNGSGSGAVFGRGTAILERAAQGLTGVRFEREFPPVTPGAPFRGDARTRAAAARLDERGFERFWIAHLPRDVSVERAIDVLGAEPGIESAERIAIVPVLATPNDSLWSKAYYFFQASRRDMSAREAWDITTGDTSIVVGILDTGVLMDHPDLTGGVPWGGNMYTNWAEQGGQPGVDDDGNGYVDDVHGWDFIALDDSALAQPAEDWRDEDNDPNDFVGHGTAVAGLVGAITDNHIGVAGTAWHVRLMPLRVGWSSSRAPSGEVDFSSVARAFHYCTVMGVDIMNCSFASVPQGDVEFALTEATNAGVLTIFSAGNNGSPAYLGLRSDVMSVAATDADDKVAMFSSRGDFVDIAAAGVFVSTTSLNKIFGADSTALRQPDYATSASGTSFSAPLVAGAAALLQAQRVQRGLPRMAPLDVQLRLMDTADDISAQNPGVTGYGRGRLNLLAALTAPLTSFAVAGKWQQIGAAVVVTTASGHKRIYYATADSSVLVTDAEGGAIVSRIRLPGRPSGGLAAADMGGGLGLAMFVPLVDGRMYGFDVVGHALSGWPVAATPTSTTEAPTAALGDLDGDGRLEVVWGGTDGSVWAWNADGTRRSGFPRFVGAALDNVRIALCDVDAEPGAEIVTSSPSGSIYVIDGAGRALPYWPRNIDPYPTPPTVMHVSGTTDPIIVVASLSAIYAFKADASLWRAKLLPGTAGGSMATGDLDGDGRDEIVVPTSPNQITVFDDAFNALATFAPNGLVQRGSLLPAPVIGPLGAATPCIGFGMGPGFDAFTPSGTHLTSYPKPGVGSGLWPTLDEIDGDGRTEIIAGAGRDSTIYVFDAGPGTWRPNASPWPTVRANFARTGTRLYSPPLIAVDDEAPFSVADLGVTTTMPYQVGLQWTAPADRGGSGLDYFDVRFAAAAETLADFESAPHLGDVPSSVDPGAVQSAILSGLEEDRTYYLAMRAVDKDGNPSTTSNIVTVVTPSGIPDAISDLGIYAQTDTSVSLRWSATGDDGHHGRPRRYRLRAAEALLTPDTFDEAPIALDSPARLDPGAAEVATLAGLTRGTRYWIAIEAEDDRGHRSGISNVIDTRVGTLPRQGFALAPARVPSAPPIELQWDTGSSSAEAARLDIHDIGGRRVRRFQLASGSEGIVDWDGRDERGESLPPGLYFARLSDGSHHAEARIVMVK